MSFPEPVFKMKKEKGKEFIFDTIRKQWLLLTEEEWVRQNFIQNLVQEHHYPVTMIAIEKEILLGELKKRFDILVYDKGHKPWMLVECKGRNIKLNDDVLQQVLRYNISVPVTFMIITNGDYTYGWEKSGMELKEIERMPGWE